MKGLTSGNVTRSPISIANDFSSVTLTQSTYKKLKVACMVKKKKKSFDKTSMHQNIFSLNTENKSFFFQYKSPVANIYFTAFIYKVDLIFQK